MAGNQQGQVPIDVTTGDIALDFGSAKSGAFTLGDIIVTPFKPQKHNYFMYVVLTGAITLAYYLTHRKG